MLTRTLLKPFLLGTICALAVFGADNSIGTWKLNVAKSTFSPPPMPVRSLTTIRTAVNGGVKVVNSGEMADGTAINSGYSAKYDGSPSSIDGTIWDTISVKQVDDNTFTNESKKNGGSYHTVAQVKISADGKTMTVTSKGTTAEGKPLNSTFIYEKQ
ncbi:MAG TPA: hypothetical protein VER03_19955 [Bryobacteraceae bacterium]|nr:hypothetical protein [Bryobacteraceae bacterium]